MNRFIHLKTKLHQNPLTSSVSKYSFVNWNASSPAPYIKCGVANIKQDIALNTTPHAIHFVRFFCPQKYANISDSIICDISLPLKITPKIHKTYTKKKRSVKSLVVLDIFVMLHIPIGSIEKIGVRPNERDTCQSFRWVL